MLVACIATWLTISLIALLAGPPLGHDEAQYAVAARDPHSPWLYLSPGMIAIARIGIEIGGNDWMLRLAPVVLGTGVVVATWWLGRIVCGGLVGAWAAAVLVGAHPIALRNSELLGDLTATACLLAGTGVLVRELERERPSWWLMLTAPALAAAFYVRYGSAPMIACVGVVAAALWWRRLFAAPVLATLLAFFALLLPHAIYSLHTTGSTLGVLRLCSGVPYRAYPGEGLVTYVTSNPFSFYGFVAAPVMFVGIVGSALRPSRARLYLLTLALGQIVMLGLQTRAQPRYVCFAIALLLILGADVVLRIPRCRRMVGALVALSWLGELIAVPALNRHLERARAPLALAAATVRRDAAGRACTIAASTLPQLMWRTGCTGTPLSAPWPSDRLRYIIALPSQHIDGGGTELALPHDLVPRVWSVPEPDQRQHPPR